MELHLHPVPFRMAVARHGLRTRPTARYKHGSLLTDQRKILIHAQRRTGAAAHHAHDMIAQVAGLVCIRIRANGNTVIIGIPAGHTIGEVSVVQQIETAGSNAFLHLRAIQPQGARAADCAQGNGSRHSPLAP